VGLDLDAIGRCTRVKKTYDFNLLRELTQVAIDDDVDGLAHLTAETRATVQDLRQGLRSGRIIDWGGLESALQLTTGYQPAVSEHGTHVAVFSLAIGGTAMTRMRNRRRRGCTGCVRT